MNKKGFLISIEGIDGAGKSLLAKNLSNKLTLKNFDVLLTNEPGGTSLGKKLRKILHEEKENVCDLAEFLLFASDRAQHFKQIIIPSLKDRKIIISDRLADSSLAYQGYARELDIQMIKNINNWAMHNIEPDLIFYIKIDIKTAIKRIFKRNETLTSFEKEKTNFWQKVLDGYEKIFKNRKNIVILDGMLSPEKICDLAINSLINKISK
ncbi:dTMP kinase [Candidatus Babeliales bacterium]|nr:dTMP kinase [Candidatus Babeliales bacterium]